MVTFSLYRPWAKVRKLKFFARNMRIADASFDYHASPWSIFKGQMVVLVLFAVAQVNPWLAGVATLIGLALLPWVLQRSIGFKLRNTSYRNLRFGFDAPLKIFYGVTGVIILILITVGALIQFLPEGPKANIGPGVVAALFFFFALTPLFILIVVAAIRFESIPYSLWGNKRFSSSLGRKAIVKLLIFIGYLILVFVAGAIAVIALFQSGIAPSIAKVLAALFVFVLLGLLTSFKALVSAKLHNLAWNDTRLGNDYFRSDLSEVKFAATSLYVFLLTILTLGLYRAWGAVRLAKMQTESIVVYAHKALEDVEADATPPDNAALGQEAADWFDIDISF